MWGSCKPGMSSGRRRTSAGVHSDFRRHWLGHTRFRSDSLVMSMAERAAWDVRSQAGATKVESMRPGSAWGRGWHGACTAHELGRDANLSAVRSESGRAPSADGGWVSSEARGG